MFRNYLAASLRNLARNKFYSSISIVGLAIGLCAAILMSLLIRNQLSFERFIPGYERTYLAISVVAPQGRVPDFNYLTNHRLASQLKLGSGEIEAITRLSEQVVELRHDQVATKEKIYWADQNVFDLLPFPVYRGDIKTALYRPDGIVMTRSMARKYFGRDNPLGESIQLDRTHQMVVTAVIEDLPINGTQLESGVFASGLASYSKLAIDSASIQKNYFGISVLTYLRLAPNASIETLKKVIPDLMHGSAPDIYKVDIFRIDKVHLFEGLNPTIHSRLLMASIVGALILLIACINFINLSTARSTRRALEVGIRKASGASRGALMLQFLGESLLQVFLATCIAVALAELLLPYVNAFANSGAAFDYWHDPMLIVWIGASTLTLGILAGMYPAFVLSAFRPVIVSISQYGGALARHILVTLQFAILIGLVIAAGVIYQQRTFATSEALRVDTEQILIIRSPCNAVFKNELRALVGVRGALCSHDALLTGRSFSNLNFTDGTPLVIDWLGVEPGVFALYGLKSIAGEFSTLGDSDSFPQDAPRYVLNEAAVRRLGFVSAATAIGQPLPIRSTSETKAGEIIGVVPDFSINAVDQTIRPTIYDVATQGRYQIINVKLSGRNIPETLTAIDNLWSATGATEAIDRFFLNDYIQNLYLSVLRQAQAFGVFSCIAVLLACLGLFGLSASTTERRTKEIGIRKALGASTVDVMRLLLWQFTKPVLVANLVAWPVAAYVMNRWLQGFAYHIDLSPWLFIGATGLALAIALLTVSVHCYLVARAKPVTALRYE